MLAWWIYATLVAAVLALAAFAMERLTWRSGIAARGVWAAALVASLAWPLFSWWRATFMSVLVSAGPESGLSWTPLRVALSTAYLRLPPLDAWLPGVWLGASVVLVLTALLSHRRLVQIARRCHPTCIAGVPVWLGAGEGPAVFGVWRPRILMPAWIAASSARERRLALIHELSHVRAGDLPLLWASFAIVCAMPWNAAAWWILRRLRQAVEIDCDRRVLSRHGDAARSYGNLLVRTATARRSAPALVFGLSSGHSLLRRRIERLGRRAESGRRFPWLPASLATACLAVAAILPAPALPGLSTIVEIHAREVPWAHIQEQPASAVYGATAVPDGSGVVTLAGERPGGDQEADPAISGRFSHAPAHGAGVVRARPAPNDRETTSGEGGGGRSPRPGGGQR